MELIPIQLKKTTILLVSIYCKTARVFSLPAKKWNKRLSTFW